MLTNDQKQTIEMLADTYIDYGAYKLARLIDTRAFDYQYDNDSLDGVIASFYSILNVVRRHRQRQAA